MSDEPLKEFESHALNVMAAHVFFAILFLVGAVAAIFIGTWIADHLQSTQAAPTTSEHEQVVPDCVLRSAHEFDSQNQNQMRALAQESGLTFENYRRMIIVAQATIKCPKP